MMKMMKRSAAVAAVLVLSTSAALAAPTPYETVQNLYKTGRALKLSEVPSLKESQASKKAYRGKNWITPATTRDQIKAETWIIRGFIGKTIPATPPSGPAFPGTPEHRVGLEVILYTSSPTFSGITIDPATEEQLYEDWIKNGNKVEETATDLTASSAVLKQTERWRMATDGSLVNEITTADGTVVYGYFWETPTN